jgi:hypothetical protein
MQNSSVSSVVMLMSSAWGPAPANSRLQAGHAQLGVRPSSVSTTHPPTAERGQR